MAREARRYSLLELAGAAAVAAAAALAATGYWSRGDEQVIARKGDQTPPQVVDEQVRRERFERIYERGDWGKDAKGKGVSGPGSTLAATRQYRAFLQDFLAANRIRSVVDAGCGDWEFSQKINWKGIDYLGLDIVPAVVEANRRRFGSANVRFAVADIVRGDLPPADLLIVKDVLQHLSNADIALVLKKLQGYRHVLIVNDVRPDTLTAEPTDIATGGYRLLDVTRPPYSVPGMKVLTWRAADVTKLLVHVVGDHESTGSSSAGGQLPRSTTTTRGK